MSTSRAAEDRVVVLQDGRRVEGDQVGLSATDPGLLLGWTAFETLRSYDGVVFRLGQHLDRLAASCGALDLDWPGHHLLAAEILAVAREGPPDAMVRVTITGGGTRLVRGSALPGIPGEVRCVTRPLALSAISGRTKHGSRLAGEIARSRAGVDEVLWVDDEDCMLEGTRSNIVAVRHGRALTPPLSDRILEGVTRGALLELGVVEAPLPASTAYDELYVCSTLKELVPVVELDGRATPGWGSVGRALLQAFQDLVLAETEAV